MWDRGGAGCSLGYEGMRVGYNCGFVSFFGWLLRFSLSFHIMRIQCGIFLGWRKPECF